MRYSACRELRWNSREHGSSSAKHNPSVQVCKLLFQCPCDVFRDQNSDSSVAFDAQVKLISKQIVPRRHMYYLVNQTGVNELELIPSCLSRENRVELLPVSACGGVNANKWTQYKYFADIQFPYTLQQFSQLRLDS